MPFNTVFVTLIFNVIEANWDSQVVTPYGTAYIQATSIRSLQRIDHTSKSHSL